MTKPTPASVMKRAKRLWFDHGNHAFYMSMEELDLETEEQRLELCDAMEIVSYRVKRFLRL